MQIDFTDEEVSRLRSVVRERLRKINKAFEKFGADFDPVEGAGLLRRREVYTTISEKLDAR